MPAFLLDSSGSTAGNTKIKTLLSFKSCLPCTGDRGVPAVWETNITWRYIELMFLLAHYYPFNVPITLESEGLNPKLMHRTAVLINCWNSMIYGKFEYFQQDTWEIIWLAENFSFSFVSCRAGASIICSWAGSWMKWFLAEVELLWLYKIELECIKPLSTEMYKTLLHWISNSSWKFLKLFWKFSEFQREHSHKFQTKASK